MVVSGRMFIWRFSGLMPLDSELFEETAGYSMWFGFLN